MKILKKFPQKELSPKGWLEKQLRLQADGLTVNIAKYFPDLSNNSAWLGGDGEAWERGPYYLDGLVPLAFLLNDKELIKKVYHWVDSILGSENSTVGFGPLRNNDHWPRMVVQKALISFYRATKDERVIEFLLNYYRYMLKVIDKSPLYFWAGARAFEGMEAIFEVYEITKESFILELVKKLKKYSYDWWNLFSDFRYLKPMKKYTFRPLFKFGKAIGEPIDALIKSSQKIPKPKTKNQVERFNNMNFVKLVSFTHGVNIAMAYKYPVAYGVFTNDKAMIDLAKKGYESVMKYHGLSIGLHSSDEHLMGVDASGGVELCTVVEQAYSFEEALRLTKDTYYADLIEFIVFNALPATFTQDMTAHQYVQQPNQIAADRKPRQFFDINREANIFGVAPNFGCCAANMHQGFPKFAENLAYYDDNGIYFLLYSPCELDTEINGKKVIIEEKTEYPFEDKITFNIQKAEELSATFRVAKFTKKVLHNGKEINTSDKNYITISVNSDDKVELFFDNKLETIQNPDKSISIKRNNLLFCMPLSHKERYVRGEKPFHYREFVSDDKFNFSPILKNGVPNIIQEGSFKKITEIPFNREKPNIEYRVKAKKIENWKKSYNSAKSPPKKPLTGEETEIKLVPYGSTYLRITQFPKVEE